MFRLAPETWDDSDEVEYLYDLAFAPGREALSSYRLRDGVAPVAALSLVARDEYDVLAGAIRYWPVKIGTEGAAALLLGPVAVHPTYQGEGVGGLLIRESLDIAQKLDWKRVILIGDEPYYSRFGFQRAATLEFPPPTNPDRLLALELQVGSLDQPWGMVRQWEEDNL
ncbi:MAG: N-acetyltransferase [Rhodobacteraceae bacterium]|nr:N-acetyltransferase [Paracoccaceae bacterium]